MLLKGSLTQTALNAVGLANFYERGKRGQLENSLSCCVNA